MNSKDLVQTIQNYVYLPPHPNAGGWYPVVCKVCNDHGRKGPRAGFRFDDTVGYHCFNCNTKAVFDGTKLSKNMEKVLVDFGVPEDEINRIRFSTLGSKDAKRRSEQIKTINPQPIDIPEHFYQLSQAPNTDKWAEIAKWYLEESRGIVWNEYPFYLSSDKEWIGRLIIPVYKDNNLIFYQGRDLTGKHKRKYNSVKVQKDKVLYGYDKLFANFDAPLYVCEGFFDAYPIDGVAIFGNELSKPQIEWLNRTRRPKVYIPDKHKSGALNAHKALELGWKVSLPDIGSCKDINDAYVKYGKLYVLSTLRDNTVDGFTAKARIKLYCGN